MTVPGAVDHEGFVVWLEGLPGAGKSTVAAHVGATLRKAGWRVEILDGDEVRQMMRPELGFTRKDREAQARRVSYVAHLLARNGVAVIVAMITPYETSRQAARAGQGPRFTEVWLQCPIEVCQKRDPKGLYTRADAGAATHVTGLDDPFEEPLKPDLVVNTSIEPVARSAQRVLEHLFALHFIPGLPTG
jgi:adenylylsulfate kinase